MFKKLSHTRAVFSKTVLGIIEGMDRGDYKVLRRDSIQIF